MGHSIMDVSIFARSDGMFRARLIVPGHEIRFSPWLKSKRLALLWVADFWSN